MRIKPAASKLRSHRRAPLALHTDVFTPGSNRVARDHRKVRPEGASRCGPFPLTICELTLPDLPPLFTGEQR